MAVIEQATNLLSEFRYALKAPETRRLKDNLIRLSDSVIMATAGQMSKFVVIR
jgi:hypothetical protein